jgi:hypothetical protein
VLHQWSDERRANWSAMQRARLGSKLGCRIVYGANVPDFYFDKIQTELNRLRNLKHDRADFPHFVRWMMTREVVGDELAERISDAAGECQIFLGPGNPWRYKVT